MLPSSYSYKKVKDGEDIRIIVDEKVEKLKEEMFISEIKYSSWISIMVMVNKSFGN